MVQTMEPVRTASVGQRTGLDKALIATLLTNAGLYIFLEVVVTLVEHGQPIIPVIVLLFGNLVLSGALLATRWRWLPAIAALFMLAGMLGTVPHDLPDVTHPVSAIRFVFGVLGILVPIIAIILGAADALTARHAAS
jgi:hypothetical protein